MTDSRTYYFDSNATTSVAPEVLEAMLPYLTADWGNPSSPYRFGKKLVEPIERARESVAALIGADPAEIIFTSCGTESNNTALTSCLHTQPGKRHIVTTAVEHSATRNSCAALEERGYEVTYLPVNRDGALDLARFEKTLRPDTAIVSIMWANNETGVLFPLAQLAAICRQRGILIHTDAVQVPGKLKIDVNALGVDLLSLSAHKLHGPKGVGLLYVRKGTPFQGLIIGGHQESGNRGGTENVPYLVGFGRAAERARAVSVESQRKLAALRDSLENEILTRIPQTTRNGAKEPRLPNTASIAFAGVEAEALLMMLDQLDIYASSGSACTTGSVAPSHVLTAMGLGPGEARSTIRFSLDYDTSEADAAYLLSHLPRIVAELRVAASPRAGARPAAHREVAAGPDNPGGPRAIETVRGSAAELQNSTEKLRGYVREVPLYRARTKAGANATFSGLLAALPFTTKQDIKTDFPKNFLRAGQSLAALVDEKRIEIEHTAGTTDNRADLLLPYGWWARQEGWALSLNPHVAQVLAENPRARRVTISSPACNGDITYNNGTPSAKRRTLGNTRVLSLSRIPFLLSTGDLDQMVAEAVEWDPVFFDTDPVYAAVFALHCERRQVKFPKLKFILTSYEYTSVLHQRILSRAFGVPVYNLYGSTETGHLLMEQGSGVMLASPQIAHLDVINVDERGIGELVVSTLTNDYMPLLNYRIGDLVERRTSDTDIVYTLHGRAPDSLKAPDGRRVTTRDVDQCFGGAEGLLHYRLHETSPGNFQLNYISEDGGEAKASVQAAVLKLEQLIQPAGKIEPKQVKFLLPEGSGKFVFNYPFVG